MSRRITRLTIGLVIAFAVLLVQLTNLGYLSADELRRHEFNQRAVTALSAPRGAIMSADGEAIALALNPTEAEPRPMRTYPHGPLYAHTAGYFALNLGVGGVERHYNAELSGSATDIAIDEMADLFRDAQRVGDLNLTLHHGVQLTARAALGDRDGAVVVVAPTTGEIVALWSRPSFDPNKVDARAPEPPALTSGLPSARAYQRHYGLTAGQPADTASADLLAGASRALGPTGIDLPGEPDAIAAVSGAPLTPLQLALAAASLANGGVRMRPYVVHSVTGRTPTDADGGQPTGSGASRVTTPQTAGRLFETADAATLLARMAAQARQASISLTPADGVELTAAIAWGLLTDPTSSSTRTGSWAVLLAPADAPTVVVAAVIEPDAALDVAEPRGGGTLATMIAATAAEATLALRAVSDPDRP
ncbi:MAG: penicillin-binding transpeptidase domain-containing protein [Acidimicrobiaceae bacterium]|nr:penicillin-binding transpeptidase domain-containing protein [Acidimicrobiaceae bacterium]